jgi:glycosyltransferase involved in cell wall biosynthesis
MKIALIRGPDLNPFEMQSFEPIKDDFELVGFTTRRPNYEVSKLDFSIVYLPSPADYGRGIPKFSNILNRVLTDHRYMIGLEDRLKGFDVAHTAETFTAYTQQALAAKRKGWVKKVVVTVWENIPFAQEGVRGRREFKQRTLSEADKFLAVSQKAKESLILEGADPEKIEVIMMGIDLARFNKFSYNEVFQNRDVSKGKTGSKKILFVGRIEYQKGIYDLIAAVAMLPEVELIIVGDGPEKKQVLELVRRLKIDNRVEMKKVSYEQMPSIYQEGEVFVLPSVPTPHWQEQFGMVLIEAMASGAPVISTFSGSIPEVVGQAAILVPPGDPWKLKGEIERLINHPQARKSLSQLGQERAKLIFDRFKVAEKIKEFYRRLEDD